GPCPRRSGRTTARPRGSAPVGRRIGTCPSRSRRSTSPPHCRPCRTRRRWRRRSSRPPGRRGARPSAAAGVVPAAAWVAAGAAAGKPVAGGLSFRANSPADPGCPKVAWVPRSERMNTRVQPRGNPAKVAAAIALTVLLSFVLVWAAAPAQADDETWFNEFHVEAELGEDGRMAVTTHVEYDFQNIESRGIYLNFVTRQDIEGDPDQQRVYDFSEFTATSSTGAATDINAERTSNAVGVYIGDPDKQNL